MKKSSQLIKKVQVRHVGMCVVLIPQDCSAQVVL